MPMKNSSTSIRKITDCLWFAFLLCEDFKEISVFSVDAGTEFLWALAAVVGCFSMILIPSFTVYFAARAKERKNEMKLKQAEETIQNEVV